MLASRYWSKFIIAHLNVQYASNVTHAQRLLTRIVYEILLGDDRVPAPSIFSPLQPYSQPKAEVCVCRRYGDANMDGCIDINIKIGEITYVFRQVLCMCP